jgi:hypothetical protein
MPFQRLVRCVYVFLAIAAIPAFAQVRQLGPLVPDNLGSTTAVQQAKVSDLLFSAGRLTAAERHELGTLSAIERQRLTAPEPDGNRRLKVGIDRQLHERVGFDSLTAENASEKGMHFGGGLFENSGGVLVWTTAIRSENADAIRLQLEGSLPPSARAYIYAGTGEVHGPYTQNELRTGSFWTNTVYADEVFLEVQIANPAEAKLSSLHIRSMAHIESPQFSPKKGIETDGTECFLDVTCIPESEFQHIVTVGRAMAQLVFASGGSTFVCSGGLLNNTREDGTPLFLTANHCFDTQSEASSLEATWNYKTTSCSDPNIEPNRALFPRSLGATLLATGAASDFTLVRLNQPPPNTAVFLGWDASQNFSTQGGLKLFRVHHPQGKTQFYARHAVVGTGSTCQNLPRGNYIYMADEVSGAAGGSSGSPVMLASGAVVGQLRGACGPNVADDCDRANRTVDGALFASFDSISQFLAPSTGGPTQCVPNATTACVLNNRFKVTVKFRGAFDNQPANTNANVKQVTGFANPAFETAFFFFNDPNNIEMLIKVLDQGNTNAQGQRTIAILFGSATPLRLEIEVTDTTNGAVKRYTSEFNQMKGTTDFNAFVR